MLKQDLTHKIISWTNQYQKEKNKKVIGVMKDEVSGKILVGLKAETYSCLIYDKSQDKKQKRSKKCVLKRKTKTIEKL